MKKKQYAVYYNLTPKDAKRIIDKLNKLSEKIVHDYEHIAFGFSDMSEDGYKGIIFNMMYGNELIHDIEYEQTLKNLKRNDNFRIKNEKDENYFLDDIIEYGDKLPDSYWEK